MRYQKAPIRFVLLMVSVGLRDQRRRCRRQYGLWIMSLCVDCVPYRPTTVEIDIYNNCRNVNWTMTAVRSCGGREGGSEIE